MLARGMLEREAEELKKQLAGLNVGDVQGVGRGVGDESLEKRRKEVDRLGNAASGKNLEMVELEILIRYLPESFLRGYLAMIDAMVGENNLGSSTSGDLERGPREDQKRVGLRSELRLKSEQRDYRGGAKPVAKSSDRASRMLVRSELVMEFKSKLDRRLRSEARKMFALLTEKGDTKPVVKRRCSGKCKKYGDAEWLFCPKCGGAMEDVV
jgi:hypothetical protein